MYRLHIMRYRTMSMNVRNNGDVINVNHILNNFQVSFCNLKRYSLHQRFFTALLTAPALEIF